MRLTTEQPFEAHISFSGLPEGRERAEDLGAGDVFLKRKTESDDKQEGVNAMRRDLREGGKIVLAHGEVTGHVHEVVLVDTSTPPDMAQAQYFDVDGQRELVVLAPCELTHQEHSAETRTYLYADGRVVGRETTTGKIGTDRPYPAQVRQGDVFLEPTSPGTWRVVQQREWAGPEQWRAVGD